MVVMQTADMALWLADNVSAIACSEDAGQCFTEIRNAVDAIERMINRPPSPKYCGNCPSIIENRQGRAEGCAVALYTDRDAVEVYCWKCKNTYNVEQLIKAAISDADGWLFTAREIAEIMAQIGEPLSERTWRHWRKSGKIQSRNEWDAEPKYYIEEVRHLRRECAKVRAS